ncbi:MAG: hypothetical protein H6765_05880 [Candidatus Peribacteria bacterium]|nr:MAG: hypothetical protein H6765_05880 [Candidatus Peribacteria bacterium]
MISDYGHHPTEIGSTFIALQQKYPDKELLAIFQPHQVRRILEFWEQFVSVLSSWPHALIYDIYAARENLENLKEQFSCETTAHVSTVDELGVIFAATCNKDYSTQFSDVQDILTKAQADQLVIIFSAGELDYQVRKFLG